MTVPSISDDMRKKNVILLLILTGLFTFRSQLEGQKHFKDKPVSFSSRGTDEIVTGFSPAGILISSNRSSGSYLSYTDREKRNFFNLYEVKMNESGSWESPVLLSQNLKTLQNDGPASVNKQGNLLVFTRNFTTRKVGNIRRANPNFGLFLADNVNGTWSNIRPFEHNLPDAHTTHPSLSEDGKILYFASDRPGGFGKYDLYYSENVNGNWSEPKNLGPVINTPENDIYPYLHSSGRLYFSSGGHDNREGGYDIFYTVKYKNEWISPVKLMLPFNSRMNDFTILFDDKFEKGFFTSARRGSLDVYSFESTLPGFEICQQQKTDNFCFVFYETSTMEIDTSLYKYRWDLGDGTTVEAVEAEHCFKDQGNFNIKLDVIDVLTKEVMFNQAEYELELIKTIQAFITCPDTIQINTEIQFDGSESYFGNMTPVEFYWDFSDGEKAPGMTVTHSFHIPGKYNIKLGVVMQQNRANVDKIEKLCSYKNIIVIE